MDMVGRRSRLILVGAHPQPHGWSAVGAASEPLATSTYFLPHNDRKRRAPSPPSTASYPTPFPPSAAKRRRPNLANGFSGLSLAADIPPDLQSAGPSSLPTYEQSQRLEECQRRIDDDDSEDHLFDRNDVDVQEVSPRRAPGSTRSSSSASDVDLNFRRLPRRKPPQQADEVEQPAELDFDADLEVEDMTPRIGVKRRSNSVDEEREHKRAREAIDVDMDIEEIPRRQRSEWYEPEKDRIVYTALSTSSRSPTPEPTSPPAQLIQPGNYGFTISPSMLTRLLAAHEDSSIPLPFPQSKEMGLVLYRSLGIPPGADSNVRDIVREWQDRVQTDAGRFETVDDDEDLTMGEAREEMDDGGMDIDS